MTTPGTEAEPAVGLVAPDVADEFPALRLRYLEIAASPGRSSRGVKHRLKDMSSRFRGPQAVAMRQEPIPWAYRVFYRHIGLDPDADRTPVEEAAVQRLIQGAFRSHNRLDDALLIGLVETGRLDLSAMVSRRIKLDDVNDAFRAMDAGEVIRSVIV